MRTTLGLGNLRARWDRLTERERLLVGALGLVFLAMATAVVGFMVGGSLATLDDDNTDMRQVLKDIDQNRDSYLRIRSKASQLEARLGHGAVQLEGLLEQAANQSDVIISETNERQPVAVGNKKYLERAVDLRIRKVGIDQLSKFLRKVETGPNLVVVTALNVRVRDDRHEDLEVEMTVSTWERAPETRPGHKKEGGGAGGAAGKEGKG